MEPTIEEHDEAVTIRPGESALIFPAEGAGFRMLMPSVPGDEQIGGGAFMCAMAAIFFSQPEMVARVRQIMEERRSAGRRTH